MGRRAPRKPDETTRARAIVLAREQGLGCRAVADQLVDEGWKVGKTLVAGWLAAAAPSPAAPPPGPSPAASPQDASSGPTTTGDEVPPTLPSHRLSADASADASGQLADVSAGSANPSPGVARARAELPPPEGIPSLSADASAGQSIPKAKLEALANLCGRLPLRQQDTLLARLPLARAQLAALTRGLARYPAAAEEVARELRTVEV